MQVVFSNIWLVDYIYTKDDEKAEKRKEMTPRNSNKSAMRSMPDATAEYIDSNNKRWIVSIEFKTKRGRTDFHALSISSTSPDAPLTRRLLQELPLDLLFREVIAKETELALNRNWEQVSAEKHQGRAHSDDELTHVAQIYVEAYNNHQPVQGAVADAMGIGTSTAAKRIVVARQRGFIPEEINKKEK